MTEGLRASLIVVFLQFTLAGFSSPRDAQAAAPRQREQQGPVARALSAEVMVDLVVRDGRGRPIRDLKPEEIEIYEEGAPRKIRSLRLVERGQVSNIFEDRAAPGNETIPLDPFRQLTLVTLVFERLGDDGRRFARQAGMEFLRNPLGPNIYVAVFAVDQRLSVLQPFTNDVNLLREAVERATSVAYSQFASLSEQIKQKLQDQEYTQNYMEKTAAAVGRGTESTAALLRAFADSKSAEITVNILRYSETLSREQQGRTSIFSLLSIVKEQRSLPGRKTVLHFSEGIEIPSSLEEHYRSLVSEANLSNVSFYTVDARGLITSRLSESSSAILSQTARASQRQLTEPGRPISPEQARIFDSAQDAIRADTRGALADLAESTGGFLIADSNDFRRPMEKVTGDIGSYYELTYAPADLKNDGSFKRISVRVSRPGVKLQARSGYFDLPALEGATLLPYEIPLLTAFRASVLPRELEFRSTALRFTRDDRSAQFTLVLEAPLRNLTFSEDRERSVYRTRFSVLALVKNAEGKVVQKFSQDVPLEGPLDKVSGFRQGNFIFTRHFDLAPGRFTLETAVMDRHSQKTSARRAALVVPPARQGIAISSLVLIRRIEATDSQEDGTTDPFRFQGGRVIPTLGDPIPRGPGSGVSFYFVIHPSRQSAEKTELTLEFFQDGQLIARASPELPPPDAGGRICYTTNSPSTDFKPGSYRLRAIVKQGGALQAEEHGFFEISP